MPRSFQLSLSAEQEQELSWARDHHPKAYVRTKAAGLLKVACGWSIRQVARMGLLKAVRQETVKSWILCYQQEGLDGLQVQTGRGRKPAFFPCGTGNGSGRRKGSRRAASQSPAL